MSILDPNTTQITGPINVIRMEGTINRIKKVIYIFMDTHYPANLQLECDAIFAKDVNQYFAESFLKLNDSGQMYDFFLEVYPTDLQNVSHGFSFPTETNYRDIYLTQVRKLFRKIFKYQPSENKVLISDTFKNVRLHYMDVRNYFNKDFFDMFGYLNGITGHMWQSICLDQMHFTDINHTLGVFTNHCRLILDLLKTKSSVKNKPLIKFAQSEPEQINPEEQHKINVEQMTYILDKMFNKYQNDNVKKKLSKQIDVMSENLRTLINECTNAIDIFNQINDANMMTTNKLVDDKNNIVPSTYNYSLITLRNIVTRVVNQITKIDYLFVHFFTRFMDVFFLRRFLDKDYITHAITYTGAYHSAVYIDILARDFNFKITHAAYSKYSDLDELNKQVKKTNADELGFIFDPPMRVQCSDLEGFPKNFN